MTKHDVLRHTFGYETFRPGQEEIVDTLLDGRNVLAVMPTGSGKSLCYQVPALVMGGLAIVVSPLVALMQDQVAALKLAGVAAVTINSAATREENVAIWKEMMNMHFPNTAWLCLRRDAFEQLYEYKMRHGLPTWEEAIARALAAEKTEEVEA